MNKAILLIIMLALGLALSACERKSGNPPRPMTSMLERGDWTG